VIKSEADYPSHTNYIPLWEITGGDWEQAVDVRPEILARGKPNTISYTDNNGVQRNMMLDASSLNKFLKSNWAWVAPSWADVWDVVEVSNLKNTFFAWEDLLPKSMFRMESELDTIDAVDESIRFGYDTNSAKVQLNTILSGEEWDYVKLNLEGFNTPADNVNVRIETVDSSGNATGTLINPDATATINPSWTLEEMSINLAWMIDWTTAGQKVAVVLSRSGALSTSNYYKVWVATADTGIWKVKTFDWTSWNLETGKKWYISSPLFMEEWAIQSKATTEFLAETTGYVEAGATAGNEFTGVRFGMIEYDGFKPWDKVFLTDTGELSNISWAIQKQIGSWVKTDVVEISSIWIWWGWWVMTYDAVVAADGSWDYTTIMDALNAWQSKLYIKNWTYTMTEYTFNNWFEFIGESQDWVVINIDFANRSNSIFKTNLSTAHNAWLFKMENLTMNITYTWNYWYFTLFGALLDDEKRRIIVERCSINVYAIHWCNFYIDSWWTRTQSLVKWCYIYVWCQTSWADWTSRWFLWIGDRWMCITTSVVVDAAWSIATSWATFDANARGTYIWCNFRMWEAHQTVWDVINVWPSHGIKCSFRSSSKGNRRIYWLCEDCSFGANWSWISYDTALNSAVHNKTIQTWQPNKAYTVWTYVNFVNWTYLAKCKTAHTSWDTFDSSKRDAVYWDVFINWTLHHCSIEAWWVVVLSWFSNYADAIYTPSQSNTFDCNAIRFSKSSSSMTWYAWVVVLWLKTVTNNRITLDWYSGEMDIMLIWEWTIFTSNRMVGNTWFVYANWTWWMIANNVWIYIEDSSIPSFSKNSTESNIVVNNTTAW
jgi:hypothetical protein